MADENLQEMLNEQAEEQAVQQAVAQADPIQKAMLAQLYKKQEEENLQRRELLKQQLQAQLQTAPTNIDWTPLAAQLQDMYGGKAPVAAAQSNLAANKELLADRDEALKTFLTPSANQIKAKDLLTAAAKVDPNAALKTEKLKKQISKLDEGTEQQKAAAGYTRRLEQAEQVFENLLASGFDRTSPAVGAEAKLPNIAKSGNLISQEQAERNFINAVLRRESGAAIAPSEYQSAEMQYFPRSGDTPDVLAQKAANRQQVIASLRAASGRALDSVPLISVPKPTGAKKESAGTPKVARKTKDELLKMSDEEFQAYKAQILGK